MAPLCASQSLFITTMPLHKATARIILKQLFAKVLEEAGVDLSPGSARVAAASAALARGVSENAIMEAANWASVHTLFANYARFLPATTSSSVGTASLVQNAVLS